MAVVAVSSNAPVTTVPSLRAYAVPKASVAIPALLVSSLRTWMRADRPADPSPTVVMVAPDALAALTRLGLSSVPPWMAIATTALVS